MENAKLKSSKVYAWVLVIALGLMSAGTTGSYSVIAGSFVAPVCEEFGFDYSIFSYYFTATLIGLAAALPFVGKLIPKVVGKVWLPVVELILLAAGAGMAFYTEVWMFIAAGALIGVCFAFTTGVAMSDVIDQWFKKSGGLAIGLAWAVNSIYMLIMSPVITSVIEAAGWRTGYLVLAGVSAVLILPASILIIRYKPQDKGMLPYGYVEGETVTETEETTEDSTRGVSYARAIKSPAFFFCIGFLCLVQLTCCMNQLFPTYASEVGFSPMVGGFMVSAASLFDLFLNPIVGTTCDRFGSTKAILARCLHPLLCHAHDEQRQLDAQHPRSRRERRNVRHRWHCPDRFGYGCLWLPRFRSHLRADLLRGLYRRRLWHARYDEGL